MGMRYKRMREMQASKDALVRTADAVTSHAPVESILRGPAVALVAHCFQGPHGSTDRAQVMLRIVCWGWEWFVLDRLLKYACVALTQNCTLNESMFLLFSCALVPFESEYHSARCALE